MKKVLGLLVAVGFIFCASQSMALIYVEDFEEPFPNWEADWLGTNTNIQNYYGVGSDRGNNPDGLWVTDGDYVNPIAITFDSVFGATVTSFSIDITTWVTNSPTFEAFDKDGTSIFSTAITSFEGGFTNPGSYQTISFLSSNGLSGFTLTGSGQMAGNTSIDNVVVNTGIAPVPEPTTMLLFGTGLAGLVGSRIRRKKK